MNAVAITQISLNFLISASMSMFFNMIGTLNVICFQLMLNLNYPGNVQMVMGTILGLLNAEMIDPNLLNHMVFNYDPDVLYVESAFVFEKTMFLNKQIYDVGFETYNPVLNLGGLYFIFLLILINMGILATFKVLTSLVCHKRPTQIENEGGVA